jgi:cation diffusion facilitator family transporter
MNPASSPPGSRRRAALLSLGVGLGMLVGKWFAYVMTGSDAILSDAMESVVHVAATGFAFVSILLSERPPDRKYPYGYGKIAFVSAGFEGAMILLAALAILYEAGRGLWFGRELRQLDRGVLIILLASAVNLALGLYLVRLGRRTGSLILEADGAHVLTDSWTSFGVVAGVLLVLWTGRTWLDGAVAIAVGLNILWTGGVLVRAGLSGLMDRADPALLARIVAALQEGRRPGWIDLHQLRQWTAGDRTFVDFHLVVPEAWTVGQLHDTHDACRDLLRKSLGPDTEVIIHFDPDRPELSSALEARPWTVSGAVRVPGTSDLGVETDTGATVATSARPS